MTVPTPWLNEAPAFDIHEITTTSTSRVLSQLLASDVAVLVLDPIRLLDSPEIAHVLPYILGKKNLYFVINGEIEAIGLRDVGTELRPFGSVVVETQQLDARHKISAKLNDQIDRIKTKLGVPVSETEEMIMFVSTSRALKAMDALRSTLNMDDPSQTNDPTTSAAAFTTFKDEYLESNLGVVSTKLLDNLKSQTATAVQLDTAQWVAASATRYVAQSLADVLDETHETATRVTAQAEYLARLKRDLKSETFTSGHAIKEEVDRAKRQVQDVLASRLAWWKVMSWRVDTVAEEVGRAVEESWAVELSQKVSLGVLCLVGTRLSTLFST